MFTHCKLQLVMTERERNEWVGILVRLGNVLELSRPTTLSAGDVVDQTMDVYTE